MKSSEFPVCQKLRNKADFSRIFNNPERTGFRHLLALWKPGNKLWPRLGIIAGKRVAKTAVARNRIKRIIRESFRLSKSGLANIDMVVIAREHCDKLGKTELRNETDSLWKKISQQCLKK